MKVFLLDVDGVMTSGQFFYTADGKVMKVFGPDDHDGLSLLAPRLEIRFVTGDRKGFEISRKRIVEDMNYPLDLVSTVRRVEWIEQHYSLDDVIYMGDGIFDHYVMKMVGYALAPANANPLAKAHAAYVTRQAGGDRAVAEACTFSRSSFSPTIQSTYLRRTDQCQASGQYDSRTPGSLSGEKANPSRCGPDESELR
jgi:3-deoxy-D-manno-octulosonate 8-phosphate phosphatase (KDO 8-P phosphatase)